MAFTMHGSGPKALAHLPTSFALQPAPTGPSRGTAHSSGHLVVGTASGQLLRCFLDLNEAAQRQFEDQCQLPSEPKLRCPVRGTSDAHVGPVYSISFNPFRPDVFATCGMDATCHVFHMLSATPFMTVEPAAGPLFSVSWAPTRASLFAVSGSSGCICWYDLAVTVGRPVH